MNNKLISSAWFGDALTNIQRLSIRSYIDNGHEFCLYAFGLPKGVPEGTIVRDAEEIMTRKLISHFPHNSQAADLFRVLLILRDGGWWADLDTICLKPFDFPEPYVFVSEVQLGMMLDPRIVRTPKKVTEIVQPYLSNSVFKAPANAPFLQYMLDQINAADTEHPEEWISFGPKLIKEAIHKFNLLQYVKAPVVLDGFNYDEMYLFVSDGIQWDLSPKSYALHLRTSCWLGPEFQNPPYGGSIPVFLDPNGKYPEDSLFEQLKAKHKII